MKNNRVILILLSSLAATLLLGNLNIALACYDRKYTGQKQINWLLNRKARYDTGLVQSYEGGDNSNAYTFDQALTIIALTKANKIRQARDVLDIMAQIQLADTKGTWVEWYDPNDPNKDVDSYRHVTGPIAWMVMAVNFYECKTRDASYANVARRALAYLDTMQYMTPGEERYGSLCWSDYDSNIISTEHNLDAYSAYYWRGILDSNDSYLYRASLILDFIRREMWAPSPESNHWHDVYVFWRGLELNPNFCTDPQSWGVLALGPIGPDGEQFFRGLYWLLDLDDSTRNLQDYNESITNVDGYRGCTGELPYIEVDFTEHVAAAFYSIGDCLNGDYFHSQMGRTVDSNGGLVHSFSEVNPTVIRWPDNHRFNYVGSVAWYYFNETKINPFVPPCAGRGHHQGRCQYCWRPCHYQQSTCTEHPDNSNGNKHR
jgi:hypothetical protein